MARYRRATRSCRATRSSDGWSRSAQVSTGLQSGQRVGIPWLGRTCGTCPYCREGRENLCDDPQFTGATRDGGYATHAAGRCALLLPAARGAYDLEAAPLLCAGLIGWRAYRMAGEGGRLGLYGFGAAAHILAQLAVADGREVYAFTRSDDEAARLSPGGSAAPGRAHRTSFRRRNSTRRSSLRRSARWCPRRSRRCARAAAWSAPAST